MDFYNELVARAELQAREADLHRGVRGSVNAKSSTAGETRTWTREFAAWVAARGKIGETFMARTPMNP